MVRKWHVYAQVCLLVMFVDGYLQGKECNLFVCMNIVCNLEKMNISVLLLTLENSQLIINLAKNDIVVISKSLLIVLLWTVHQRSSFV